MIYKPEEKYKRLAIFRNRFLNVSHAVLLGLVNKTKLPGYSGIIIDETSDDSKKEQISICSLIVNEDSCTHEHFAGFYQTASTISDILFEIAKYALLNAVGNCRHHN